MRKLTFAAALLLAIAGCTQTLPTGSVVNFAVADPSVATSAISAHAFIMGFEPRLATGPAPWRGSNDAQAPDAEGTN
jgi:hypothetical protein